MNWLNLILSDIVTTLNVYLIIKNLSKTKFKFSNFILFYIFLFLLYIINFNFFAGFNRLIFSLSSIFLCSYIFLFKRNLNKSVYYSFCNILISILGEFLITGILTLFFDFSIEKYNSYEYSLFIFSILIFLFTVCISSIKIVKNKFNAYEFKLLNDKTDKFYIYTLVVSLFLLDTINYIKLDNNIDYYVNLVLIILIIMTLITFVINIIKNEKTKSRYNEMMEYVSKYERIINEQGKKNHEFNNQLMVLYGYIDNKKKLKEYLDSMIEGHKGGKNYTIEHLSYFPDGGLKGLIYHKLSRIEEYNIKPYLYIDKNVKETFENKFDVNTYTDITKLFGVFLDNAIEAAKDADKKEIEIDMKIKDNYLIIIISNTYNKNIDINKIGKKGFTTKGVGHGFGLSLVKDISKKNSKIETVNDVDNNMFKQTILIDLK